MALDDEFLKQVIETFRAELDERLQIITKGLLELEKIGQVEGTEKIIDEIFRSAHNIKGSARGIGISDVGEIAHHVETLFTAIKKKTVTSNPEIINLCLKAVDGMREAMECFSQKTPLTFDLQDLLKQLQNSVSPQATQNKASKPEIAKPEMLKPEASKPEAPKPEAPKPDVSESSKVAEKEIVVPAATPEALAPTPAVQTKAETPTAGAVPETPKGPKPTVKPSEYETIRVSLHNLDQVSAYMEEMQIKKIALDEHFVELAQLNNKAKQFFQTWKKGLSELKTLTKEMPSELQALNDSTTDRLSEMTSLVNKMHKNMTAHINELTMLSNSLQEEVRLLRLVPTSTLLQTLPRVVRDLAYNLKKQVTLDIKDRDTKIDKIVLEGIKDPIIHILRNAIDHGLEDADFRKAHGKPEVGRIQIDVKEEGNSVLFLIKDDGGGIDPEKVGNSALKKGLITKTEFSTLGKDEMMNLIFRPGFSTKEVITDVSGRGVGLDVVSSNLTNLKGEVSVLTEIGKGTTFVLRVPLTLATERGLIVECSEQLFVLATSFIERVVLVNQVDIVNVEKSQAILIDKLPVPLCSLSDLLGLATNHYAQNQLPIVVIKKGKTSAALLVDSIIGEREIVIKSFQAPLTHIPCVSGATLSGSGDIIIVLNLSDVMDKAVSLRKNIVITQASTINSAKEDDTRAKLLVVDDSLTTRSFVQNVLTNNGYNVVTASDGKEAWDILQKEKFNLLITDIEMPNMDGFTLTDLVKKSSALQKLPVIIVTSLDNEEHRKRGTEVGADAYIIKSEFDSGGLIKLVTKMV